MTTTILTRVQLMHSLLAVALVAAPVSVLAQQPDPNYDPQAQQQQQGPPPQGDQQAAYNQGYQDGMASVTQAPPPIPEYEQPEAPGDGYIWTPGYWAWGPAGYYWVPGAWVEAPYEGALWTPGYWGFDGSFYYWNPGYWGPVVGYYGGINYGFGYFGVGFYGGYWNGGHFFYNRYYAHVGGFVHNVYGLQASGVVVVHPGGRSFSSENGGHAPGFVARGGTFNRPGQAYAQHGGATGFQGRPAGLTQPQMRQSAPAAPHYETPGAPHYAAPAAPHYSAPAPRSAPAPEPHAAPAVRSAPASHGGGHR